MEGDVLYVAVMKVDEGWNIIGTVSQMGALPAMVTHESMVPRLQEIARIASEQQEVDTKVIRYRREEDLWSYSAKT